MPRPVLVVLAAAVLGLAVFLAVVLGSGAGPEQPEQGGPPVAGEAAVRSGAVEARSEPAAVPRPEAGEGAEAGRIAVPAETSLAGSFTAPAGTWPGGGRAVLVPRADPPEGGMMGLFSTGMELARSKEDPGAKARGEEVERRIEAWLGRADPVAEAAIDPRGRFLFRDPPAGPWALELRHDNLSHAAPAPVEVVHGEHRDVGALPAEYAASVLVVVSDAAGAPIAGAQVRAGREVDPASFMDPAALRDIGSLIRGLIPIDGRTDANGRCPLTGLDPALEWQIDVSSPGFVAGQAAVQLWPGQQTLVRVGLERGASLRVRVEGPDGAPAAGARLRLVYPDLAQPRSGTVQVRVGGPGGGGGPLSFTLESGADGLATRDGLPAGRAELRQVTPGFRRAALPLSIPPTGEVEQDLRLERGLAVVGRVLDEEGASIEGAHVLDMAGLGESVMGIEIESIVGLEMLTLGAEERGVRSDAEGRFVLGGFEVEDREVHLAAVAAGYDPARLDAVLGAGEVEFRMLRACSVRGRVVADASGEPVADFDVALRKRQFLVVDRAVVSRRFTGRVDGSFEVSPAPREAFELVVEAAGFAPASKGIDLRGGSLDSGEIRLDLPGVITGLVVDVDGVPVAAARVRVSKGGPADSPFLAGLLGGRHVETAPDGSFRIGGLSGRAARLCVDAEGFAPLRSKAIRIGPGETIDGVVLELGRGGRIVGQVVDGEGSPLVGWHVQAEHTAGSGHAFARSDEDGGFVLEALASGAYKVTAMPPDYMRQTHWQPDDPSAFGDFDLGALMAKVSEMVAEDRVVVRDGEDAALTLVHETAKGEGDASGLVTVRGAVRVGGMPLARGLVALHPSGSSLPRHLGDVVDGAFRFERVRPGSYRLQVRAGLLAADLGGARSLVVPARTEFEIDVDLPGGAIAGTVLDPDSGEPVPGALLSLARPGAGGTALERMDLGEGAAIADGGGRFRFDGLEAGVYEVFAKQWALGAGAGRSGRLASVQVGPGEVRDGLELVLERGSSLRVRVRDAGGGPRANALVVLLGQNGAPLDLFHRALTDRDGLAEFAGLPAGAYRASVDAPAAAPAVSATVELRGADLDLEVELRVGVPVSLRFEGEVPDTWRGEVLSYAVWREDGALLRGGRVTVPPADALAGQRMLGLGSFAPGRYRVRVEGPSFGVLEDERRVEAGAAQVWTIDAALLRGR
jgi:protocatechuate 3,4-dioxygenase beta subunit